MPSIDDSGRFTYKIVMFHCKPLNDQRLNHHCCHLNQMFAIWNHHFSWLNHHFSWLNHQFSHHSTTAPCSPQSTSAGWPPGAPRPRQRHVGHIHRLRRRDDELILAVPYGKISWWLLRTLGKMMEWVSWDDEIPDGKNKKPCSKPPTLGCEPPS